MGCLRRLVVPIVVYVLAGLYFTWALPAVAKDSVFDALPMGDFSASVYRADTLLIIWILRWDLHALASDPLNLFNANIFHPAHNTLAGAEHLIGELPLFAPAYALTRNPVLAFNIVVLASFVLTALAMHVAVERWTGRVAAAYVAGLAFSFAPWRIPDGLGRAQLLQVQYLPLIVLALEHTAGSGSLRAALLTATLLSLQCLSSYYLAYQAYIIVALALLVDLLGWGLRRSFRIWRAVALAVLGPLVIVVPLTLPYLVRLTTGDLETAPRLMTDLTRELGEPSNIVQWYIGWGTLVVGLLAVPGLVAAWRRRQRGAVSGFALVATTIAGLVLTRGWAPLFFDWVRPYEWLEAFVPGFGNVRAPLRFGSLASFGMSALTGFAVADLLGRFERLRRGRWLWPAVPTLAAAAVLAPMAHVPRLAGWPVPVGPSIPPVYQRLAAHGEGRPLLELPISARIGQTLAAARAMYFSTYHWLPLLNGYSGYIPQSWKSLSERAGKLPDPKVLQTIVDCTGLHWILMHEATTERIAKWASVAELRLLRVTPCERGGFDALYEVSIPPRAPCSLFSSA